jgi:hypothetical protein
MPKPVNSLATSHAKDGCAISCSRTSLSVRTHRDRAPFYEPVHAGPRAAERITARRTELDELEEKLAKHLAEVRAERAELTVAERVPGRMSAPVMARQVGDALGNRRQRAGQAGAAAGEAGQTRRSRPATQTTRRPVHHPPVTWACSSAARA